MIDRCLVAAALSATFVLAACASDPPVHYYEISGLAARAEVMHPTLELLIAEIAIPETVSRSELVVQRTAHESDVLDDQRWLSPMDEQIRRAMMSDLRVDLPQAWITRAKPATPGGKRYTLRVEIQQLALKKGESARVVAAWTIQADADADAVVRRERGSFEVRTADDGYESLATAVSVAIEQLSRQIAGGISQVR